MNTLQMQELLKKHGFNYGLDASENALVGFQLAEKIHEAEKFFALTKHLETIAGQKCWEDDEDFMVDDYAGGNIDDAYSGGCGAGEILLARRICFDILGIDFSKKDDKDE